MRTYSALFEFYNAVTVAACIVLVLGLVVSVALYKKLDGMHKSLAVYLGLMLGVDLLSRLVGYVLSNNNLIVMFIFTFIELSFFMYFYKRHLFKKRQRALTLIGFAGLAYMVGEALLIFVFRGLDFKQFQPYSKVVDNFIIILMALGYLHEKMNRFREDRWGNFRLNSIILVFFTLNTIVFLPFNFMINEKSGVQFYFLTGNAIVISLFNLYLMYEIWKNGRIQTL